MSGTLDDLYLPWLYSQIGGRSVKVKDRSRTHWSLLKQLYSIEFVWIIPNDDNRAEDGKNLRYEFVDERGYYDVDPDWMGLGCSFLEMLVGLSRRLSFESDREPRYWFWHLLENLGLTGYTDHVRYNREEVDDIANTVIWRTYEKDGRGGLFPLSYTNQDQREVEIWYQLSAYLLQDG